MFIIIIEPKHYVLAYYYNRVILVLLVLSMLSNSIYYHIYETMCSTGSHNGDQWIVF